jgi:hypothetical protein
LIFDKIHNMNLTNLVFQSHIDKMLPANHSANYHESPFLKHEKEVILHEKELNCIFPQLKLEANSSK